jgi:hypothetical protein
MLIKILEIIIIIIEICYKIIIMVMIVMPLVNKKVSEIKVLSLANNK